MGVLTGHRIERKEIGAPGEFDNITDDELKRAIKASVMEQSFSSRLLENVPPAAWRCKQL